MRNIKLIIEYDGTGFNGWQSQRIAQSAKRKAKRLKTIQEEIEKAGRKLFGKRINLIGASRTDAGVHAEAQVANFRIDSDLPLENIKKGLNKYLPKNIAILSAEDVTLGFHARFNAKGKLYRFTILNREMRSPLLQRHAAYISYNLDVGAMKKATGYFVGKKDFKSFQAADKKERGSIRTITRMDIVKRFPFIDIYIQADGFLYNMVRNIVGTLVDVGRGRLESDEVKEILSKRYRPLAGQTASAKGLCLVKIFY